MPTESLSIKRILPARRPLVFEAWTRPELMARWLFPGEDWKTSVSADLSVGGRYELSMRDDQGTLHLQFGEYREIVPVSRLVFTWSCPDLAVVDSIVTVDLIDLGASTELRLRHELPPDPDVRRGHEQGWHGCLGNLEKLLETQSEKESSMSSIKDEIRIEAGAKPIYEALTTQAGYRGWWNQVAEVPQGTGGEAELRFVKDGQPVNMRFRIDELVPDRRVRWTCVAHDMPDWVGTTLTWQIESAGNASVVSLDHGGWKQAGPEPVAQGWKHFLGSLKSYVETGTGQPW